MVEEGKHRWRRLVKELVVTYIFIHSLSYFSISYVLLFPNHNSDENGDADDGNNNDNEAGELKPKTANESITLLSVKSTAAVH